MFIKYTRQEIQSFNKRIDTDLKRELRRDKIEIHVSKFGHRIVPANHSHQCGSDCGNKIEIRRWPESSLRGRAVNQPSNL